MENVFKKLQTASFYTLGNSVYVKWYFVTDFSQLPHVGFGVIQCDFSQEAIAQ